MTSLQAEEFEEIEQKETSEAKWFRVTAVVVTAVGAGLSIANAIFYNKAKNGSCVGISSTEIDVLFWVNVILAIIFIVLFIWALARLVTAKKYRVEKKRQLKILLDPRSTTVTAFRGRPREITTNVVIPPGSPYLPPPAEPGQNQIQQTRQLAATQQYTVKTQQNFVAQQQQKQKALQQKQKALRQRPIQPSSSSRNSATTTTPSKKVPRSTGSDTNNKSSSRGVHPQ